MKTCPSRRAEFVAEMLDAFESGDIVKMGNLVNDCQATMWPVRWWVEGNEELAASDREILGELGRELKRLFGRGWSAEKTSVVPQWQSKEINRVWQRCLEGLSPSAKRKFGSILEMIDFGELDSLDARYAHEVIAVLRRIVGRIGRLNKLPSLSIPSSSVQLAFEEAHRAYLYGLPKACVALCRSTLEAALRECLQALGEKDASDIEFSEMLRLPRAKTLLGTFIGFAQEVRIAGNRAVHYSDVFNRQYSSNRVEEIVAKTRTIVEHLYGLPDEARHTVRA